MTGTSARDALAAWSVPPDATLTPLGDGHINDTWLVSANGARRVLQRINPAVFPDPAGVAAKVAAVVAHLRRQATQGATAPPVPALLTTPAGAAWHQDGTGVWRLWEYVAGTRTLQALTTTAQAHAAGMAFGRFQRALADMAESVPDPIPQFMRLGHYLADLDALLGRLSGYPAALTPLLEIVEARRDLATAFAAGDRLVHGDCKVNNLLFRGDADEVAAIVDLDTVMRGHWGWDFGDLVRSAAARGTRFDEARFAALAAGFLAGSGVRPEPQLLVLAPRYVTLMLAVRFLTDHLRGDRYFKVTARGENLARARAQFDLLLAMEAAEPEMRRVASRLAGRKITAPNRAPG